MQWDNSSWFLEQKILKKIAALENSWEEELKIWCNKIHAYYAGMIVSHLDKWLHEHHGDEITPCINAEHQTLSKISAWTKDVMPLFAFEKELEDAINESNLS